MQLRIFKPDGWIMIDGVVKRVDLSTFPFRALHWDDTNNGTGKIEYEEDDRFDGVETDLTPYQPYIDAWNAIAPEEGATQDPANISPSTPAERLEYEYRNSAALRALVNLMAEDKGITPLQLKNALLARVG